MSTDAIASDFSAFQDGIYGLVMSTVKSVGAVAAGDIDFQRSSDPEFASAADATSARILELANLLLRSAAAGSDIDPPTLKDDDDVENRWNDVVEVADLLLERADTCLDEYTGAIKQKNPEPLSGAISNSGMSRNQQKSQNYRVNANSWQSRNLAKPQLLFEVKPDNMDAAPFRPLLTVKPHARIPLQDGFEMFTNELGNRQYIHPYVEEIKSMQYPAQMFANAEPKQYLPFEDTEAIFVDSPGLLVEMLQELKAATEIAVDLEHHDQRSYVGFVCLMQISTREKDWIVDTLKLRGELQILNEVFADPKIIKVLHGASMDIIWLQRDFGLYVVGLFDTYWAARTLGFQGHGLAFLLKKYVDFDADKQYQLADWRLRPIPKEMFNYARSDTHFLLYCFDHLRNELLDRSSPDDPDSKMMAVLQNSREVSLRLYEKELYNAVTGDGAMGWRNILGRSQEGLNPMQVSVFKAVHQWRDTTARLEDESIHHVMPRHQLFNLARKAPVDIAGVLSCCPRPSPPVKMGAGDLVVAIRNAKESPEALEWKRSMALEASAAAKALVLEVETAADGNAGQEGPRIDVFVAPHAQANTLRAEKSGFWGNCDESSRWQAGATGRESGNLRLAVPLPQLTAAVFVSPGDDVQQPGAQKPVDPGARAEHEYIKNRPPKKDGASDIIVVRSLGGGRKRKLEDAAISGDEAAAEAEARIAAAASDPEPGIDGGPALQGGAPADRGSGAPDGGKRREKGRKKKKEKKKKDADGVDDDDDDDDDDEEAPVQPFDYASAPSVLNQKRAKEPKSGSREKKKKAFNPYSQSGNAPKGLGRKNQEKAGRSATFKQ